MHQFIFLTLVFFPLALLAQQGLPSNKHFWHTVSTEAPKAAIWQVWTDVANWQDWDSGLQSASLDGAFTAGAKGNIISLEGRKSNFKVVEYVEGESYTFKTKLPLGALYVKRSFQEVDGKLNFTHEVWFKGITAGLFAKLFGPNFRAVLPDVMEQVKQIAESK
ncbi:MAG: SRPBCC family protein [Bacteroidota bacterium]